MTSSAFLRRELAAAGRRLIVALRLDRSLTKVRAGNSPDVALPSALECRQLIENRTAEYLAVLTQYRVALEEALPPKPEPIVPLTGARGRNTTWPRCGVRLTASSTPPLRERSSRLGRSVDYGSSPKS